MGAIEALAPGVAKENVARILEAALERAGRSVIARHDEPTLPETRLQQRHALRWEIIGMVGHSETVLRTGEVSRWDPRFLRALSAVSDGFVVGVELLRTREHYALGAMFAGRTLETKVWDIVPGPPPTGIGYPPAYDSLHGREVAEHIYLHWYRALSGNERGLNPPKHVLMTGEWETTPALDGYPIDDESPTTRVLLAQVDEPRFLAKLSRIDANGWRWRSFMTPGFAQPMIELARDGVLDTSQVASWGRIVECAYAGFEVPGGGKPPRTIVGHHDVVDREFVDAGIEPLLRALGHLGLDLGEMPEFPSGDPGSLNEAPGMMFGRGDLGWHQI